MSVLSEKIHNLPAAPGVYLFQDPAGKVLYVGKAKSLLHRVRSYLGGDHEPRIAEMVARAAGLDVILTGTEVEALLVEASLIRQHRPPYNVLLQDDKSFPYVRVSVQEEFPRVSVTRQVRSDGARYLGPYTDVKRLRRTLREIRRIFPFRSCRNFDEYRRRNRPCLFFHIRRCLGPCTTHTRATPGEYRAMVDGFLLFLTGRDQELLARLRSEMQEAAAARDYERAARRRDQIELLESARVPQAVVTRGGHDTDVIGLARHGDRAAVAILLLRGGRVVGKESREMEHASGEGDAALLATFIGLHYLARTDIPRRIAVGHPLPDAGVIAGALSQQSGRRVVLGIPRRGRGRKLLGIAERNAALALEDAAARAGGRRSRFSPDVLDLQRELGLAVPPWRMVCFDISNLGPEGAVAAVVASENGKPRRSLYRRMRIRRAGPDDFAMIAESVERWWARVESGEMPRPDLVVIDGGIGQLGAARAALDRTATRPVPLVALAKREETVVREEAPPLTLPRRSPALRSLQRLRDEAHRFGLAYHRLLRTRARVTSELDRIPGIGPARRTALLRAFGSIAALREASAADIAGRARLPLALAARIAERLAGHPVAAGARRNPA